MSALPINQPTSQPIPQPIEQIEFELAQIADAFDRLEAEEGTDSEVLEAVERYFGDLLELRDEKINRYVAFMREREARAKIRREEAARLAELARVDERKVDRLKSRLLAWMEGSGITKFETAHYKLSVSQNGGVVPLTITVDPEDLPKAFQKVEVKADTDALRKALEAGLDVPGASLGVRGTHLRIR
jgi:hypothetical protein